MNFVEKVLAGEEFEDRIDAYIEAWHCAAVRQDLHEFLGFTWDEYALWTEQPNALRSIFFARRTDSDVKSLDWDNAHLLAARSQSQHDPEVLLTWLKQKGLS